MPPIHRVNHSTGLADSADTDGWQRPAGRTRAETICRLHALLLELVSRAKSNGPADFLLVTDEQIDEAERVLATHAHTLAVV
jgi:hypothetical protein